MKIQHFREDINGLRALAVLSVVAFHFSSQSIPGGFAGVDIFFVISGFLMTSIIMRGIINNDFSIWHFLKARAKRIIPALTFVTALVLVIGYLCFDTITYKMTGKHAISSLSFISNYIYQSETGYFDVESKGKPFLHTWSLSVEWQFYVLYPVILATLCHFISISKIKKLIVIFAIISFVWCVFVTYRNPVSSYFILYSRAWEMLLGGVAFIYPLTCSDKKREIIEFFGLAIIIGSIFFINESTPWPGYMALLPVAGAYICILANNRKSLLSGYIIQRIGLWSYSIYLIHWPFIVIMHKLGIDISFKWFIFIVIFMAFITYELVEKKRTYGWGAFGIFSLVIIAAWYIHIDGVSERVKKPELKLSTYDFRIKFEGHLGLPSDEPVQYFNSDENNFDYILIGDSFSRHYYSYFRESGTRVASFAIDGCKATKHFMRPLNFSQKLKEICKKRYDKEVNFINTHPGKKIIVSMTWKNGEIGEPYDKNENHPDDIISELDYFLQDIKESGSEVYIIGNTQGSNRIMYECLASKDLALNKFFTQCESHIPERKMPMHQRFIEYVKKHNNVHFIDPTPALCQNGECIVLDGETPVYTDTAHLTRTFSNIVGKYVFDKIKAQ